MWRLKLFSYQMMLSHVTVVLITAVALAFLIVGVLQWTFSLEDYRARAMLDVTVWQFDHPHLLKTFSFNPEGFSVIVDDDGEVLYATGLTTCTVGASLAVCAPELVNVRTGTQAYEHHDETWVQTVMATNTGQRVISQRGPYTPALNFGSITIEGIVPILLVQSSAAAVMALPLAFIFSMLVVRPQVRRIADIATISRQFANGNFDARVRDHRHDEVGQLGQQFDDMADTIQKNFQTLRELAEKNAALARQVEEVATQNERLRLARDLHDTIAQRLFSLSITAATLPDAIAEDVGMGAARARTVQTMAESTLTDLRALLVDLRPPDVIEMGLTNALGSMVDQWQEAHGIAVESSMMLGRTCIPTIIQDTLYRISQEALNNVARHANATAVTITLVAGQRQIALGITDNGDGFDPNLVDKSAHFGLSGMHERMLAVGGTLTIESSEAGTSIQLNIPLDVEETSL